MIPARKQKMAWPKNDIKRTRKSTSLTPTGILNKVYLKTLTILTSLSKNVDFSVG